MKELAKKLLSEEEKKQVEDAVSAAERETSGEIATMIVPASHGYPMADVIGGVAFSLPISIILTPLIGGMLWMGTRDMWLFLGIFALAFLACRFLVVRIHWLKRRFISKQELSEEVAEAAETAFYRKGLYRTRDENGILIYISVFERKVWVLADRGITEKVGNESWKVVADMIVTGISEGKPAGAVCLAVQTVGEMLARHFPVKSGDTDELKNLIID